MGAADGAVALLQGVLPELLLELLVELPKIVGLDASFAAWAVHRPRNGLPRFNLCEREVPLRKQGDESERHGEHFRSSPRTALISSRTLSKTREALLAYKLRLYPNKEQERRSMWTKESRGMKTSLQPLPRAVLWKRARPVQAAGPAPGVEGE